MTIPSPVQQPTSPSTPSDAHLPWPRHAEADFEYRAADDEEVSFHKHDLLQVIDSKGRWWKVKTPAGQIGLAPSNYITLLPSISPDDVPKLGGQFHEIDPLTEEELQSTSTDLQSDPEHDQPGERASVPKAKVDFLWQNDKALAKLEGRRPPRFELLRRILDEIRRSVAQVQVAYECTMQLGVSKSTHDIALYVGT